jgi:spoIIIJ-associated protein
MGVFMVIQDFLQRLLGHMGIEEAEVEIKEEDDKVFVQINISEEDSGLLIGYHGDVLASLQRITQLVYREEGDKKFILNVNDYKQRREAQLKEMVSSIAYRVLESGEEYVFAFLPANERLIVHQTISENPEFVELESMSIGDASARRLHIRFKEEAAA